MHLENVLTVAITTITTYSSTSLDLEACLTYNAKKLS